MKDILKIGLVIADELEYVPMRKYVQKHCGNRKDFYKREGHMLSLCEGGKQIDVYSVLCGIGMVNAAAAAMFLVENGIDIIINTGLSGGISNINRGEITIGTQFIEHDFDLTPLGKKPGEKPSQKYIYDSDADLLEHYCRLFNFVKKGVMVSGDSFVGDENLRNFLKETWNAMSCDMESAAVAYVCDLTGTKFTAVRCISDDAGSDASESYTEMNERAESALLDIVFKGIYKMFDNPSFWQE
ncbi:MAG TPA: 5'-methylthioadenosine/S-adenosylhomocysteine nucleosidase [Clostridiales bacterium]|nr:5'-methylthioadenosine/S-adenosylhomocysteine nucleosidase [Clostridiales bacterium]